MSAARCDTCKQPVDDAGRVTRRRTFSNQHPGRVIAATCSDCLATVGELRDGQTALCGRCRTRIYWSGSARRWLHTDTPWFAPHPAEPPR